MYFIKNPTNRTQRAWIPTAKEINPASQKKRSRAHSRCSSRLRTGGCIFHYLCLVSRHQSPFVSRPPRHAAGSVPRRKRRIRRCATLASLVFLPAVRPSERQGWGFADDDVYLLLLFLCFCFGFFLEVPRLLFIFYIFILINSFLSPSFLLLLYNILDDFD